MQNIHRVSDPHSYSRPNEAVIRHIDLSLKVDFDTNLLEGLATLTIEKSPESNQIILDTNGLEIAAVTYADGVAAGYELTNHHEIFGAALDISLRKSDTKVTIRYRTNHAAEAVQWLSAEQTAGKKFPFMFTQSQAILARSWVPLQDSPGVRFTYTADVKVPRGMLALMSAENPQQISADGKYHFAMEQPIPSYLMSLAVGNIAFAAVGPRTGVYAEPEVLEKAAWEFAEMEDMLTIAEKLYGEYRWGRYDLIVLPPSFPFGGMENPRITFATPTILAGDRSLTSLVAHELAHSWSGNLVTNGTWNDFWLNEGFTVYFETRIMEALKGVEYAEMLASLNRQSLVDEVAHFMNSGRAEDTKLKLNLAGRNPDDGVNTIAYDKGYFFLRYLENYVGREKFDAFVRQYFSEYAFRSNYTEAFVEYLEENLFQKNGLKPIPDLDEWIYGTGLPSTLPQVTSVRFAKVEEALASWKKGEFSMDTDPWSSHEWVYFIKNLLINLSVEKLAELDKKFHFTASGNAEILGVWFVHCARAMYEPSFRAIENFLVQTGRRKFLMPIYKQLIETAEGKKLAVAIYQKARPNYHFVAVNSLEKLLS
ncbi:MAG: M1 family metallopeptidase [Cyclobacteriaceae bacterium]|nr:M1 family metallopeptidase [Cyclobacteriaceae bacterium]